MLKAYRIGISLLAPFLPLWIYFRALRGKEDLKRRGERFGKASLPRPKGTLLWMHAASIGEANSVLPLLQKIQAHYPHIALLLTTGTVTSARLMQTRLKNVIHHYAPLDTLEASQRFIQHWKPDISLLVESELWPNLILEARRYHSFMGIINARMSERSFSGWQKRSAMIRTMLACFDIVFAQSEADASRYQSLGAKNVFCLGNLKYDAKPLACDEAELLALKTSLGSRPVWLAASTHPGEEKIIAEAQTLLLARRKDLLCIIVPRHPNRGLSILQSLKSTKTKLRSQNKAIDNDTSFYIADTLGELGLFYRLCGIAFMGGSLVKHGGQNPLEPARLSCAVVSGPYTYNFADIYAVMENTGLCHRVKTAAQLAGEIDRLLSQSTLRTARQMAAKQWVDSQNGGVDRLLEKLAPILELRK